VPIWLAVNILFSLTGSFLEVYGVRCISRIPGTHKIEQIISKENQKVQYSNNGKQSGKYLSGNEVCEHNKGKVHSVGNCHPFYFDRYDEHQKNSIFREHYGISKEQRQVQVCGCNKNLGFENEIYNEAVNYVEQHTQKIIYRKFCAAQLSLNYVSYGVDKQQHDSLVKQARIIRTQHPCYDAPHLATENVVWTK
jgi:hypothetical protein